MFRITLYSILMLMPLGIFAQGNASVSQVPVIDLSLTDGRRLTNQDLVPGAFVLVYFSPDCEHCKQFITGLIQKEKLVRSKQIVLASFVEVNTLKTFEEAIGLRKFPNVRLGSEGESYRIARGMSIKKFPFVALFDGSRKLVRTFEGEQPMGQILEAIEQLK
jgi:thiol-disulfide isomerase/thioredoxin